MLNYEIQKIKIKNEQKKSESTILTHKSYDLGYETMITP
jgi:hypothetical protein